MAERTRRPCPICGDELKDLESHLASMHRAEWFEIDNKIAGLRSSHDGVGEVLLLAPLNHDGLTWKEKLSNLLGVPLDRLHKIDLLAKCSSKIKAEDEKTQDSWEQRLKKRLAPRKSHVFVDDRGQLVSSRRITVVELNRQYRMEQVMLG